MKKRLWKKATALVLSATLMAPMAVSPAWAVNKLPTQVTEITAPSIIGCDVSISFDDEAYLNAIKKVTVNGNAFTYSDSIGYYEDNDLWSIGNVAGATGTYKALKLVETRISYPATVVITADGYNDMKLTLEKSGGSFSSTYTATVEEVGGNTGDNTGGNTGSDTQQKVIGLDQISISTEDWFKSKWYFGFADADYVSAITGVSVNGNDWEAQSTTPSLGGKYCVNKNDNRLEFAKTNYSSSGTAVLQNGDVITITADGYADLTFKFVVDAEDEDKASVAESDSKDDGNKDDNKGEQTVVGLDQISIAQSSLGGQNWYFSFANAENYVSAITGVSVNGTAWEAKTSSAAAGECYYADVNNNRLDVAKVAFGGGKVLENGDVVTITAKGYADLTFKFVVDENDKASVAAVDNKDDGNQGEVKPITVDQLALSSDMFGHDWYVDFKDADGYVSAITAVSVNGTTWEAKSHKPSAGGSYYKNTDENRLVFSKMDFSSDETVPVLKSGDSISITAKGYETLNFKLLVDKDGNASLVADDGQGDVYELKVKLVGSFEAAIVGQKDYDGVSSASTSASLNKNSNATLYGALVEKGTEPADSDWEELDNFAKVNVVGSKSSVNITADTEKGTSADSDSGMRGVYIPIDSAITLNGEPKTPGNYLVSVTVTDDQGRTATSNALPFRVYSGKEALADQITTDKLTQTKDGKYMWDIMEPWAISNFGSNVEGEENSVRVPTDLKAWYGSHQSGTYGKLGYDLAWEKVEAGEIPQTLYIPNGCTLTMVNMEVLSSVHVVVENGGKLILEDSSVQGIVDVQSGGTFSMNYNDYKGEFLTGASICGQLRMADGSTLENAAIYSHINYLANGDLDDRTSAEPVVVTNGNVTVKGQVFINGDAGGSEIGQAGLRVKDGTLTLADDAVLAVFGGEGNVVNTKGGTAIQLDNGTITGNGKVIAVGGEVLWEKGGNAVSGTGTISAKEAFLQGATASKAWNADPGKAIDGDVTVTSSYRHIADGTVKETTADDPLADLYWKTGIDATPNLDNYPVEKADDSNKGDTDKDDSNKGDTDKGDDKKDDTTKDDTNKGDDKKDDTTKDDDNKKDDEKPSIEFTDVEAKAYYADAVKWAVENNITNGMGDNKFAPEQACTRGQIVTFLWRAAGEPKASSTANKFTDVKSGEYYYDAVQWAVEKGIAKGMTNTTFEPNTTCTRAQTVTFLWRAAGAPKTSGTNKFSDVKSGTYYYDAVLWAVEKGITTGTTDTTFSPNELCTRGQIVTFMHRDMA